MIKTRALLVKLGKRFPRSLAEKNGDYYVGLQTGKLPEFVNKIVVCLDFDETIFEEVKRIKPDLVISHHPFIFGTKKEVFAADPAKELLANKMDLLGIPVYSYHTNFDEGNGGMNDALSEALGLKGIKPLKFDSLARGGTLETPMKIDEFAKDVLEKLDVDYGLLIAEGSETIKTAAIIGGGGSSSWYLAKEEGYDIFISGDIPHHRRREIVISQYNYLDLPHEVEKIFMPTMKKILLAIDQDLEVIEINQEQLPKLIH